MSKRMVLEVCAFNIQSAVIAERAGAARVELCDNPVEGGTNPSYGTIRIVREKISIQLYPILRPRSGNYFYDEAELAIVKEDIRVCKELGCDGISVGIQTITGDIDMERFKQIVEWAYPMGVTCNRAFDATPDPYKALEDIIACGCERVLTSGQASAAPDAGKLLGQLVQQANGRISIMPGAGVRSSNIKKLIAESGAYEYHTSARKVIPNPMLHGNPAVLDSGNIYMADIEELKAILAIMQ
ncbi:copper homeostasis protein CutC [Agriterribacter sp.]|uniref:copper homeostasis protein CutC n=1 Tax=Agriterribacter sp. TaxID=2821509 RepID=UPI002D1754B9|nr:copper homeostasis protein CutC [Agriterribacter sp.]HTN08652.1 copper homeostasis protein CutC [Agriterribacter sp.]